MVNLKNVAKEAGVSTATVSRFINNKGYISDSLKKRIRLAIKKLNYYPNKVARNLSKGSTRIIGIIIPDITNPFFPEIVKGVSDLLFQKNYYVHLCSSENDPKKEETFLRDLKSMWIDGIIIIPSDSENRSFDVFNKSTCPIVIIDREIIGLELDMVIADNKNSAYTATDYLIENGHKKILFLGGLAFTLTAQKRFQGWEKAMKENNLPTDGLYLWGKFTIESGYKMMLEAFNNLSSIDAVFASNDLIALGAIKAIREKNLNIPKDISIIGFDDINISKFLTPPLTVIHQQIYQMGRKASEILLDRIKKKGKEYVIKKIIVPGELIIRESVSRRE